MKLFRRGRLLFRTYLIIVGGLAATAAVFDYGFLRLQDTLTPPSNAWAEASLTLIEQRLAAAAPADSATPHASRAAAAGEGRRRRRVTRGTAAGMAKLRDDRGRCSRRSVVPE